MEVENCFSTSVAPTHTVASSGRCGTYVLVGGILKASYHIWEVPNLRIHAGIGTHHTEQSTQTLDMKIQCWWKPFTAPQAHGVLAMCSSASCDDWSPHELCKYSAAQWYLIMWVKQALGAVQPSTCECWDFLFKQGAKLTRSLGFHWAALYLNMHTLVSTMSAISIGIHCATAILCQQETWFPSHW